MFDEIKFSDELQKAKRLALDLEIPEKKSVGVHIRGGDIFYDKIISQMLFEWKTIPLPIAYEIVQTCSSSGKKVFVFAQDETVFNLLKDLGNTIIPKEIYSFKDRLEQTF